MKNPVSICKHGNPKCLECQKDLLLELVDQASRLAEECGIDNSLFEKMADQIQDS